MTPDLPFNVSTSFQTGQRLQCPSCGAEIEIITPCTCNPPDQVLRCCGQDMVPVHGEPRRLSGE